jgi:hypothetical protein
MTLGIYFMLHWFSRRGNDGVGETRPDVTRAHPQIFQGTTIIYIHTYICVCNIKNLKFSINICSCFKLVSITSYTKYYYAQSLRLTILKNLEQFN